MYRELEERFAHNAWEKFFVGEAMSLQDMRRVADVIANKPLSISDPTEEEKQAMKAELLSIIQQRFFTQPPAQ